MDRFRYNLNSNTITDEANVVSELSGVLEIYVHHARNIHNICIYDNQDVYAKFSLTYDPDETLSTRIVNGGGKNPDFNESMRMNIAQLDAVLKCEIWMHSRARNYMEDQLLGFALVPVSQLAGKAKLTQDYSLSSTDLFHSPAGTVKLTLSLNTSLSLNPQLSESSPTSSSSITSEVVLLDRKVSEEYSRIEFPDIGIVRENQQMVSEYFDMSKPGAASFLHLGACPNLAEDYEMTVNSSEETQNSGFFSSTATSPSDDRNSADSTEKKNRAAGEPSIKVDPGSHGGGSTSASCPDTPTSKKGREAGGDGEKDFGGFSSNKEKDESDDKGSASGKFFPGPLGGVDNMEAEAEQSAMQQQIVDMYMRSMQQFTESLAKMKLPMELDQREASKDRDNNGAIPSENNNNNNKAELEKKDGSSRVFYGSRAFF